MAEILTYPPFSCWRLTGNPCSLGRGGTIGSRCIDTTTGLLYVKTGSALTAWTTSSKLVGDPSSQGYSGNIGDRCIDTTTGQLYIKVGAGTTAWSLDELTVGICVTNRTMDPPNPAIGEMWLRTDL